MERLKLKKGEYAIVKNKDKFEFVKVIGTDDNSYVGTLQRVAPYDSVEMEFVAASVVANLGERPAEGSAYGTKIEPYYKTTPHDQWNDIHWFVRPKKSVRKMLFKSLSRVYKKLKSLGLEGRCGFTILEMRPKRGKWAGTYHYKPKADFDLMTIHSQDYADPDYLFAHEYGHGVWYRMMSKAQRARWVKLYSRYAKMQELSVGDIRRVRKSLVSSGVTVKEYLSSLEDTEAKDQVAACLDAVFDKHGFSYGLRSHDQLFGLLEFQQYSYRLDLQLLEYLRSPFHQL
jgi:hypothetical protein